MPEMRMAQAINNALVSEMKADPNVFIMGEDVTVGVFRITSGLVDQFGDKRVRDTPITESAIIGSAVGAAACGLRPVVEIMFVDFIGVAIDQLFNQAAKMKYMFGGKIKLPLVVRTTFGAGFASAAQHSQSLESWFMHIPGLKVAIPSTPYDAKGLLISAIRDDNPVVFLECKTIYGVAGEVPEESYTIPFGQADIKREGTDVTVVATARMVHQSLAVAQKLEAEGISLEIVDPRTLSPLDEETILESVRKTNRLVIVHEEVKFAGSGAEIAAMVAEKAFDHLDAPIIRVGAPFTPVPFSPVLEKEFVPDEEKIIAAIKTVIN
jgi:pyruvate dehydrogenase E1 component beta subunit